MEKEFVNLKVEESSGDKFNYLTAAQEAALHSFVACLEPTIQEMIEKGDLIIWEGKIIPDYDFSIVFIDADEMEDFIE
jgi:hypothetical protein